MPFLHLPIQSGSNKILKEMNRKHTREDYLNLIKKIRFDVPNMAFSSDFIVGYPGETDNDFQQTLDVINKVKFASSYSFIYSPRPGTKSSLIRDNSTTEEVARKRLKIIQELLTKQQNEFNIRFLGKTEEILISSKAKKNNQYVGRTKYLQPVHIFSSKNIIGQILRVKLKSLTAFSFHGEALR